MKRAQARIILRARLSQADVAADNADYVSLLLEGLREVVGKCHELMRVETRRTGGWKWPHHALRNIAQRYYVEKLWGKDGPVENLAISCPAPAV